MPGKKLAQPGEGLLTIHALRDLIAAQAALPAHKGALLAKRAFDDRLPFGDFDHAAAVGAVQAVERIFFRHFFFNAKSPRI